MCYLWLFIYSLVLCLTLLRSAGFLKLCDSKYVCCQQGRSRVAFPLSDGQTIQHRYSFNGLRLLPPSSLNLFYFI